MTLKVNTVVYACLLASHCMSSSSHQYHQGSRTGHA